METLTGTDRYKRNSPPSFLDNPLSLSRGRVGRQLDKTSSQELTWVCTSFFLSFFPKESPGRSIRNNNNNFSFPFFCGNGTRARTRRARQVKRRRRSKSRETRRTKKIDRSQWRETKSFGGLFSSFPSFFLFFIFFLFLIFFFPFLFRFLFRRILCFSACRDRDFLFI